MENITLDGNINSVINKIIANEQNNNAILKEKYAVEDKILNLKKSIKEAVTRIERAKIEKLELTTKGDQLRTDIEMHKIQLEAIKAQVEHAKEIIKNIKFSIESGITDVWQVRKTLTNVTQELSEECDVWALMTRHIHLKPTPTVETKLEISEPNLENHAERLKLAEERKRRVLAERDRLRAEPDVADDFVRIRNALRYFSEINANERK